MLCLLFLYHVGEFSKSVKIEGLSENVFQENINMRHDAHPTNQPQNISINED